LERKYKYTLDASIIRPLKEQERLNMPLMKRFTKRLNLNISPQAYEKIRQVANKEGRKTGNMARQILEKWALNRKVRK
jgi:hypothetical protein